jgi:SAM-dependent methyltransferase
MSKHNQRGYDQWAATYDTDPNSTVAADDLAFPRLWSELRGQRVLELGCGTGRQTTRLLEQGNTVVALDLSAEMLARARARCPGVRFVHGDVLTLAPGALGEPFQAALSALVLEHVTDLPRYFGVVAAHLVPGARYYVSELHPARAQAGRLAHFVDPATGRETWLDSTAHAEGHLEAAAATAGLLCVHREDAVGSPALGERWRKYLGQPLTRMWIFERR